MTDNDSQSPAPLSENSSNDNYVTKPFQAPFRASENTQHEISVTPQQIIDSSPLMQTMQSEDQGGEE